MDRKTRPSSTFATICKKEASIDFVVKEGTVYEEANPEK